jgi:hypothetical protein
MKFVLRLAICELWLTKEVSAAAGSDLLMADRQWTHQTNAINNQHPVDLSTFKCKYSTGFTDEQKHACIPTSDPFSALVPLLPIQDL